MKILVISLARETVRRARIKQIFEDLGLDFQFVEGVDAMTLPEKVFEQFLHRATWGLSRPEVGCLLAHSAAWKVVAENNDDATLILEDDVHFSSDFVQIINTLKVDQTKQNVYRLETMLTIVDASCKVEQEIGKYQVRKLHSLHVGCAGYILSRKSAQFLLSNLPKMKHAVDIEVFSNDVGFASNFNIYQVIPGCVIQDQFCSSNKKIGLGSALDAFRPQNKSLTERPAQNTLIKFLKKYFKAVYLQLYSLFKSKKGLTRIFVDFSG
jgi:glycosyl transferase, family 25